MQLHDLIASNTGRHILASCALLLVMLFPAQPARAQRDSSLSRWTVGIHLGSVSNNNMDAMRVGKDTDSLAPLDVGLKDALRSGVSVEYDVWHTAQFGLSVGGFFSQSSLDFGLVDSRTAVARHLGDATLRLAAVNVLYDLGDHSLFEFPDHNTFLVQAGLNAGIAWLSAFRLDGQTGSDLDIKEVTAGSELFFGVQTRLLWRVFDTRWVASVGGSFLHAGGDSFLIVRTGPSRGDASGTSAFHFALFEGEIRYRL